VTKGASKSEDRDRDARLENALVYLLASTRRTRRGPNLIRVARELAVAREGLGLRAVAELVGVGTEMLREFASVEKLSPAVKKMIADGRISSVDVAYRLSMLPDADQSAVAKEYAGGNLSLKDVRDVVSFRRRNREKPIRKAIERVKASRDVRRYIVKFRFCGDESGLSFLRARFSKVLGKSNIVSLEAAMGVAMLTIAEEGRRRLQEEAKRRGITKRKLVEQLTLEG